MQTVSAFLDRLKNPYSVEVPGEPTQSVNGFKFDFNDGARLLLPPGDWYVQLEDAGSDNILFAGNSTGGWVLSAKKYFVRFKIRVWERSTDKLVFEHTLNLKDKHVLIKFPMGTIGDVVAWMSYVERFQQKHQCFLEVTMQERMAALFREQYPSITFTSIPAQDTKYMPYASYRMGLFFGGDTNYQPVDFRQLGLHTQAAYILGVDTTEQPPRVKLGNPRKIKEKYVCISCKGSAQNKYWNNAYGWEEVIEYLKGLGYRVMCIDRERTEKYGFIVNRMPYGCEDFTGNIPLKERIALLEHADFFVGLGSGLSWLAWCCHIPIVMISGFSLPWCEFYTPYRVFNPQACNGCWNDVNTQFENDYMWCPRQKDPKKMFECTKLITGKMVISAIQQLIKDNNLLVKS